MGITREQYLEKFAENLVKAIELTKVKNADYSIDSDPYKNFRDSAIAGTLVGGEPLTIEQTILVRLADKDARIKNLLSRPGHQGQVADEKIEDTIMDRIVYSNILLTYLQLGRPEPEVNQAVDGTFKDWDDIPVMGLDQVIPPEGLDLHEAIPAGPTGEVSPFTKTSIKSLVAAAFGWNEDPYNRQ